MTLLEALNAADAAGLVGHGDPDCDCNTCVATRDLRAALTAANEAAEAA